MVCPDHFQIFCCKSTIFRMDPNEANSFGWQEGFAGFAIQNGVARFRPLRWKEVLLRVL